MTLETIVFLFLAGALGGALNSVAGGGSFIAFPALLWTGVPPIPANATNTIALWTAAAASGGAYRKRLDVPRRVMIPLLTVSLIGGLGGAYLTLGYTSTFVEGITGGRGFVALAVVIVGRWSAAGIAAVSLLFGAAMALQFTLQASGAHLPYQLFLALPYVLTIGVLAIAGGQAQAPSALGAPYLRD